MEIRAGSRWVVAQGGHESEYTAAWRSAYAATQEALDVWSARGMADLDTNDPFGDHIAFWDESSGSVVRTAVREIINATVGTPHAEVRDGAGNLVAQPPPPESWHQSMRFYRQSQRVPDIFDALRSLWLALENLLDDLEPFQQGTDRESDWLRRALNSATQHVQLTNYMPSPSNVGTRSAPQTAAYKYFYDDLRTHLFHAKASRQPTLPHDTAAARDLAERHERLTRLYLDLLSAMTGVRRAGGGVMIGGFEMIAAALDDSPRVLVSDDPEPFDPDEGEAKNGHVSAANAARVGELEAAFLRVFVGHIAGESLSPLIAIRRIMFEAGGKVVSVSVLDGDLVLRDVDRFSSQVEFGLRNTRMPKTFPAT